MGDLSEHFSRKEFECSCGCGTDTVDAELIAVLEDIREYFKSPVKINSGHRCKDHNKTIGGADKSMHITGKASDIEVDAADPQDVCFYLCSKYPEKYGIGNYSNFTHIDVRKNKARW